MSCNPPFLGCFLFCKDVVESDFLFVNPFIASGRFSLTIEWGWSSSAGRVSDSIDT